MLHAFDEKTIEFVGTVTSWFVLEIQTKPKINQKELYVSPKTKKKWCGKIHKKKKMKKEKTGKTEQFGWKDSVGNDLNSKTRNGKQKGENSGAV